MDINVFKKVPLFDTLTEDEFVSFCKDTTAQV